MSIQKEHFKIFFMSGCYVGKKGEYLFIAEEPKEIPDPFAQTEFLHIFYRNGKWESGPACNDISLYGGYTTLPSRAWVMVSFLGGVLRIDEKGREWEKEIPRHPMFKKSLISNVKIISGTLYTVSSWRVVRRRDGINKWVILDNGLPDVTKIDEDTAEGFSVIDGFSEDDIYAAGLEADIWRWDGKVWKQLDIPTNANICGVCCGGDGMVYLSTNVGTILVGRKNKWKIIKHELDATFRNMVWFKDRVYMAKGQTIYEIKDGKFKESELNKHKDRPVDCSFIDANDEVMLIGSKLEIATFDGEKFTTILPFKIGGE